MKKATIFCSLLAILLVTLVPLGPARADEQVERIFSKVKTVNPKLKDYKADIDIAVHAKVAFIPYNPKVVGSYYHKAPDKHKLVLEKAPSYLKKYPNIFGWSLPKIEKFHSMVKESTTFAGQPVWHVVMLPKQGMGDIESVELWINRDNYSVPRQCTFYKNNGKLQVDVVYTRTNGFLVFDKMTAEFQFPAVRVSATATANYSNYVFNQGLTDAFFKKD